MAWLVPCGMNSGLTNAVAVSVTLPTPAPGKWIADYLHRVPDVNLRRRS